MWPIVITSGESDDSKKFEINERIKNSGSDFQKVCGRNAEGKREWNIETSNRQYEWRNLPLNDDTISKLKIKHSQASAPDPIILLPDEAQNIHPIRYEDITAEEVSKAAINTKVGSGPSGLDADSWRDHIVDTQKNLFFSYQEYWYVHPRKQISDLVKRSINVNNKRCCCSEVISNIVLLWRY